MSDILQKDISRQSYGAQAARDPSPPQPSYCIDIVSQTQTVFFYVVADQYGVTHTYAIPGAPVDTITHTCFPGSPGTSGTPGVAPSVATSFNLGWSGSAISAGLFEGDQMFQFSLDGSDVGVVCGLNDVNEGPGYIEMEHALYGASGQLQVVESGTIMTTPVSFITSDVLTIARLGAQVRYWKNSTLLYTSLVPSSGTKFIDVSMYSGGDKVS